MPGSQPKNNELEMAGNKLPERLPILIVMWIWLSSMFGSSPKCLGRIYLLPQIDLDGADCLAFNLEYSGRRIFRAVVYRSPGIMSSAQRDMSSLGCKRCLTSH